MKPYNAAMRCSQCRDLHSVVSVHFVHIREGDSQGGCVYYWVQVGESYSGPVHRLNTIELLSREDRLSLVSVLLGWMYTYLK